MAENQNIMETVIQLRNDTKGNWETDAGKGTTLLTGEVAVEINGNKAKLKVGTADGQTFENAPYIGGEDAQIFQSDILNKDASTDDDVIIDSLTTGAELHAGDMAIVKRYINGVNGAVSYTSYVYEPDVAEGESHWVAMDGNYSASNVFLKSGITLAGDYTSIGNYEKGKTTIAAGTSIESLLSGMLQQELEPTQVTSPAASISASGGSGEVGTTFSAPSATLTITDVGSYTYGPATGIQFNIGKVKLAEGADPTTATNHTSNNSAMEKDDKISLTATKGGTYGDSAIKYTFSGSASYTVPATGSVPVTNLGNERPGVKFSDGSVTVADKEISFTGYRKWFKGGDTSTDFNSATIRKLSDLERKNATFELKAASYEGCSRIVIAIPTAAKKKVSSVLLKSSSNADITGEFKKINTAEAPINIEGANGATAVTYDVWEYKPASLDSTEVYTITIANA